MRPWKLAPTFLLAACGARTALSGDERLDDLDDIVLDAGRDAGRSTDAGRVEPRPIDAICVQPDGGFGNGDCGVTLRVLSLVKSGASCFVDTSIVENAIGRLVYDCDGGGAVASFGASMFLGSFDGASFDTCTGTSFDFSDGCRWNSAQRIRGEIGSGVLGFEYAESPAPGERGCFSACTATATLEVIP